MKYLLIFLLLSCLAISQSYKIEGKVRGCQGPNQENHVPEVVLEGGLYRGFVRADGRFTIHNVVKGSYVAMVICPWQSYEPVRVEISSKGSIRARVLDLLKPSSVKMVKYPLEFQPIGTPNYFQKRETFRIIDILKSPYVLTMALPVVLMMVMSRVANTDDPELKKEMEEQMNRFSLQNNNKMPDVSDMMTNFFSQGNKHKRAQAEKKTRAGRSRKND